MNAMKLLPRLFVDAGNALTPTPQGFKTGHEPVHRSQSGHCVTINDEKSTWHCHSCSQGGDVVQAAMSLKGLSREAAEALVTAAGETTQNKQRPHSQATELVKLAEDAELWHTPDGDAWASFPVNGHREHANIRTKQFRRWLVRKFYEKHSASPGAQAIQDAIGTLEGKAFHNGQEHPVYLRIAEHDGAVYVDLANASWEVVEITASGWHVIEDAPVRFMRAKGMLPLPTPLAGNSLEPLRTFLNVSDEDWLLIKAWLVGAMAPSGPYPLLEVHGEQGSAKSTPARLLRSLIDPSTVPLRKEPKTETDLIVSAAAS